MKKLAKWSTNWHRKLKWYAGASLIIWAISGALHPIISWTGPSAVKFFPPKLQTSSQSVSDIRSALNVSGDAVENGLVATAKVLPSKLGPVLQLTHDQMSPRKYIDPETGESIVGYDVQQARWLANYYTGLPEEEIGSVDFVTEFSMDYPWVNRLLPVYRVAYPNEDNLVAYVHTETGALAGLANDRKLFLQSIFQVLHTWNWLDFTGFGRVLIVGLLMFSLFMMAVVGMSMIAAIPSRKIKDPKRRWHRVAAYFLWLPLLGWSISGFYHLLKAEYVEDVGGLRLDKQFSLESVEVAEEIDWLSANTDKKLNAISVVRAPEGKLLLRMGIAQSKHRGGKVSREEKYEGRATEKNAIYVDPQTGAEVDVSDRERAIWLAKEHSGFGDEHIGSVSIVTRFGSGYDFRNKRLPVWSVNFNDDASTSMFIDPVTGVLVDQARGVDKLESLSFSVLHKWSHLNAVISRQTRDILIVLTLFLCCCMGVIGILLSKRRKSVSKNTGEEQAV